MAIAQWAADTKFRPRPRPLVEFSKTTVYGIAAAGVNLAKFN